MDPTAADVLDEDVVLWEQSDCDGLFLVDWESVVEHLVTMATVQVQLRVAASGSTRMLLSQQTCADGEQGGEKS